MARRGPERKWRFLLNIDPNHLEVHDLDNETQNCQIDEIIDAHNARYLEVSSDLLELEDWLDETPEYDGCAYCLTDLHHK